MSFNVENNSLEVEVLNEMSAISDISSDNVTYLIKEGRGRFIKRMQILIKDSKTETFQKLPQPDFEPPSLWSFHHCSLLLELVLNDRQREEWIGDLEEALYKIYEQKYPRWRLHFETLRRVFYLLKGLFIAKINSFVYKRRTTK